MADLSCVCVSDVFIRSVSSLWLCYAYSTAEPTGSGILKIQTHHLPLLQNIECSKGCPEASDAAVSKASSDFFVSLCTQAVGPSFNLTGALVTVAANKPISEESSAASVDAHNSTLLPSAASNGTYATLKDTTASARTDGVSCLMPPAIQHIITGTLVFSVLFGGASLIL
ncbi:hypothetical protein CBS101457_001597 [Exobasidium rhododendri]|nr:hypothetical protein CBS101457_001597 [Exobasidium rhododendri]